MRLVIFDFDKTLTMIDSGLLVCLTSVIRRPSFLLAYISLYLRFSHQRNFHFKNNLALYLSRNGISRRFLYLNMRSRVWGFMRSCLENRNTKVVIMSGSSKPLIQDYFAANGLSYKGIIILDYLDLHTDDYVLLTSKVKAFAGLVDTLDYCSIIHLNDNLAELNAVRLESKKCITNIRVI